MATLAPPAYSSDPYDSDTSVRPLTPKRRGSESSTERSQYADVMPPNPGQASQRVLNIYTKSSFSRDLTVGDASGTIIYYADMAEALQSRPDVSLHAGDSTSGPIVGAAKFRYSRSLHLCLGDPSHPSSPWEDMTNPSIFKTSKYHLSVQSPGSARVSLLFERTHRSVDGVTGLNKMSGLNYRIVDEQTGQVLAVYLENGLKSWKKKGKIVFYVSARQEIETWIVLGVLGLCEKARRRAANSAGAGTANNAIAPF
ncbi:hypothetical protein MMC25_000414 [Agyrium rufum]|nr:hypothetical protein [Agyrium rufum]